MYRMIKKCDESHYESPAVSSILELERDDS